MRRLSFVLMGLSLLLPLAAHAEPVSAPPDRLEDHWDLSVLFATLEVWDAEFAAASKAVAELDTCNGKVASALLDCTARRFNVQKSVAKLYVYASNLSNVDTRDSVNQARKQKAEMLWNDLGERTANFAPEILAMGASAVEEAIVRQPELGPYQYFLRSTMAHAPHTLDADGEAMLAATNDLLGAAQRSRDILINAEYPWPTVKLSDGTTAELTPPHYAHLRALPNPADRKLVFDAFFGSLKKHSGTLGSTLDTTVQGHWMVAKARKYPTSVAAAIDGSHIPAAVYDTLVASTNRNLPTLHRYLKLRAKMLGLSELAYSDLYSPLVALDRKFPIDEAKQLTLDASKPLGPEYATALSKGFSERWMDVYPRAGKRSGAYMDGAAYDAHPFLLLNYTGDYDSVSTVAHEWGHAMHSVFASRAQPYAKADYAIFIAEITSTMNEALLLRRMLDGAKSDDEKLFYLGTALETLRTTYFRQAQFAEFELAIHDQVEKGEPLTGDTLTFKYLDILRRYYGAKDGITRVDDTYGTEWAYIPHFYYNFYVYQYATSIAASSLLAEDVLSKKKGALDRYLGLLRAGGSDDPYLLLQKAGVDLATPAPYDALAKQMNGIMDEMEAILERKAAGKTQPAKRKKR